jgi:hypothetical protein
VLTLAGDHALQSVALLRCARLFREDLSSFSSRVPPLVASSKLISTTAKPGYVYIATITSGDILEVSFPGSFAPRFFKPSTMMLGRLVACIGVAGSIASDAGRLLRKADCHFSGSTIAVVSKRDDNRERDANSSHFSMRGLARSA